MRAANDSLVRFLPQMLDRLRVVLTAKPATLADVPAEIRRDYIESDGAARLQVVPVQAVGDSDVLRRFVAQVQSVAPDAGGAAVGIVASADTIIGAFRTAAIGAILTIAVILLLLLRHPADAGLVLAPLLMSAALTVLIVVASGITLNFANIIALPLLLGVGVSFNIYFVMNARAGERPRLVSATTRAVVFSRAHHRLGLRLAGPLGPSRHRQHGHAAPDQPRLHPAQQPGLRAGAAGRRVDEAARRTPCRGRAAVTYS